MLLACGESVARQRTQNAVEREKREAKDKIARSQRQLTQNEEATRRQLHALESLEGEIREREGEEARLEGRAAELRRGSRRLADTIRQNEARLAVLRESYGKAVRNLHRQRRTAGTASYILSSSTLEQARSRMRYLRELSDWQRGKTMEIDSATALLTQRRARLDTMQSLMRQSIDSLGHERRILGERRKQAKSAVASLKKQSGNLKRVISEQQRRVAQLDAELNRIIEEEARARREAASKQNGGGSKPGKAEPLGGSFAQNKGKLPLPLDRRATVTSTFGRHTHENLEKVTMQNNGIDFETVAGASARAVFDGTVSMVIVMDGYHNVVLLRHGDYLTVYAGLSNLRVRKGDTVKAGDLLGDIFVDQADNNRTRLHFEIRHEKEKLDPGEWLRK